MEMYSCHRKTRQLNRIVIVNEREKEHSEEGEKLLPSTSFKSTCWVNVGRGLVGLFD